jgi:hypothetical protein
LWVCNRTEKVNAAGGKTAYLLRKNVKPSDVLKTGSQKLLKSAQELLLPTRELGYRKKITCRSGRRCVSMARIRGPSRAFVNKQRKTHGYG